MQTKAHKSCFAEFENKQFQAGYGKQFSSQLTHVCARSRHAKIAQRHQQNVTEEEIDKISVAFEAGYDSVKLYFMMGLPTETDEDIKGIAEICKRLKQLYWQNAQSAV